MPPPWEIVSPGEQAVIIMRVMCHCLLALSAQPPTNAPSNATNGLAVGENDANGGQEEPSAAPSEAEAGGTCH